MKLFNTLFPTPFLVCETRLLAAEKNKERRPSPLNGDANYSASQTRNLGPRREMSLSPHTFPFDHFSETKKSLPPSFTSSRLSPTLLEASITYFIRIPQLSLLENPLVDVEITVNSLSFSTL